jgi:hypothetical protein
VISLPCSHCQKTLEVDEAFAGGVCRCQHCGTIQTVPAHLKKGSKSKDGPPGKSLYKHPRTEMTGSGLANLSDPGGSGLSRPELGQRKAAPVEPEPVPSPWPIRAAIAGIVLLVAVLLYLVFSLR